LILESFRPLSLKIVNGRDDPSAPFRMILMVAPFTGRPAPSTAPILGTGRGILGMQVVAVQLTHHILISTPASTGRFFNVRIAATEACCGEGPRESQ